jgi:hypothetical protein
MLQLENFETEVSALKAPKHHANVAGKHSFFDVAEIDQYSLEFVHLLNVLCWSMLVEVALRNDIRR